MFITHSVDEAVTLGDRIMIMTAHPGRSKLIVDVPFEGPRKVLELRARPEYGELVYSIWGHLRDEVHRARAGRRESEMSQPLATSAGKSRRPVSSVQPGRDRAHAHFRVAGHPSADLGNYARLGCIDVRFFPAPSKSLDQLMILAESGQLWIHFAVSTQRLFWGFLFGGIPALILGVSMGLSRTLRMLVEPVISATYPVPKSAILPLVLLIFGLGEPSKTLWSGSAFLPNRHQLDGRRAGDQQDPFRRSRNFGASRWQVFTMVALPGRHAADPHGCAGSALALASC